MTKSKILAEIQQVMIGLAESERREIYKFLFDFVNHSDDELIKILIRAQEKSRR
jgi:hypothetical protein